ncbi:unnamed protein product [Calypogeia fissa]
MSKTEIRGQCLRLKFVDARPLAWVMEFAAIIAIFLANNWPDLKHTPMPDNQDFVGIMLFLIINATISFIEENNAGNAAVALMAKLAPTSIPALASFAFFKVPTIVESIAFWFSVLDALAARRMMVSISIPGSNTSRRVLSTVSLLRVRAISTLQIFVGFILLNCDRDYISIIQEKLDEMLDRNGGLRKRRDAAKQYLKLLVLTSASGDSRKDATACR